ncbi:glycoside hydrolase family 30 protein [Lacihabitans soyangensis]|uniref:Glucosylceramidase n=1 Tax=Lacihabitans soyangensis TaxID=869394 RepID=A0AAE3H146_9BACT|nr:glycoside hydrolase family 30 beta sandwich domain-containing protein [Lacihabitans soyangensis]MCP9762717.1 glucosylceramidase [Lacihabitans soyangensis]
MSSKITFSIKIEPFTALVILLLTLVSGVSNAQNIEKWVTKLNKSKLLEKQKQTLAFSKNYQNLPTIFVDDSKSFQSMDGFGYTLTSGSATLINQLSNKKELLNELFGHGENSIRVNYLRVSVGASDLSDHTYSYSESKDLSLKNFSLKEDEKALIPVLKEIIKINPTIKILASPWSPPTWMKSNNNSMGGSLLPEYSQVYADYLVKYIKEMKKHGIVIDALTIQNEPLHPGNNPSLLMLPNEQANFIKNNLGPTFLKNVIKTKIIVYDHNADRPDYPISILNDPAARKYIDGSAFHLYGGSVESIGEVHEAHPDKNLYFTEQWIGHPSNFGGDMAWHIKNLIIGATRNWCKTVLEWNLAIDPQMNPHTDGGCTACLGAVTIDKNKIERNAAYYIIGHASKFVPTNSKRIASNTVLNLQNVAFKTPEGKTVLIVINDSDKNLEFLIGSKGKMAKETIEGGSVVSYVW